MVFDFGIDDSIISNFSVFSNFHISDDRQNGGWDRITLRIGTAQNRLSASRISSLLVSIASELNTQILCYDCADRGEVGNK